MVCPSLKVRVIVESLSNASAESSNKVVEPPVIDKIVVPKGIPLPDTGIPATRLTVLDTVTVASDIIKVEDGKTITLGSGIERVPGVTLTFILKKPVLL